MKYIVEFSKSEDVKYVSHLDVIRMFNRTMRRCDLPMSYSQGFNPHSLMTFAHPLGVGISSKCELVKIAFETETDNLTERLNKGFPPGFRALNSKTTEEKSPFKGLKYADYTVKIMGKIDGGIEKVFEKPEIIMEKKTKSGVRDTDIRPLIKSYNITGKSDSVFEFGAILNCGEVNLKPELLINALEAYSDTVADDFFICRNALLDENEEKLIKF